MRSILLKLAAYTGCAASLAIIFAASGATPLRTVAKELQTAAVFFVPSITIAELTDHYYGTNVSAPVAVQAPIPSQKKVRILIVPGHQPDRGGTNFGGVYERDVVVDIADALATLLSQNPHYDVLVARTKTAWHPTLQNYFDTHELEIDTFQLSQKAQMALHLADGSLLPEEDQVYHDAAPSKAALQLYGINKWTSDNAYDITLHLHINDYAGRHRPNLDKYEGFAVYVPNHQFSNAEASKAIGEAVAVRLNAYHATSTLPREDVGVVEDQELIATGSNNTADDAALLIEYGYIYEPQFQDPSVRSLAIADYALQTYLGLQDFFKDPISPTYGSVSFPYDWSQITSHGPSVYALQAALHHLGYYPPAGENFSDCPVSGSMGACTRAAIRDYQRLHGLEETGTVGPATAEALSHDTTRPSTAPVSLR